MRYPVLLLLLLALPFLSAAQDFNWGNCSYQCLTADSLSKCQADPSCQFPAYLTLIFSFSFLPTKNQREENRRRKKKFEQHYWLTFWYSKKKILASFFRHLHPQRRELLATVIDLLATELPHIRDPIQGAVGQLLHVAGPSSSSYYYDYYRNLWKKHNHHHHHPDYFEQQQDRFFDRILHWYQDHPLAF